MRRNAVTNGYSGQPHHPVDDSGKERSEKRSKLMSVHAEAFLTIRYKCLCARGDVSAPHWHVVLLVHMCLQVCSYVCYSGDNCTAEKKNHK